MRANGMHDDTDPEMLYAQGARRLRGNADARSRDRLLQGKVMVGEQGTFSGLGTSSLLSKTFPPWGRRWTRWRR
jgi:hypothetical protein